MLIVQVWHRVSAFSKAPVFYLLQLCSVFVAGPDFSSCSTQALEQASSGAAVWGLF